jgi:hypothetical protein
MFSCLICRNAIISLNVLFTGSDFMSFWFWRRSINCPDCIVSSNGMICGWRIGKDMKEAFLVCFKILSQRYPEASEENYETPQPVWPVCWPNFETGTPEYDVCLLIKRPGRYVTSRHVTLWIQYTIWIFPSCLKRLKFDTFEKYEGNSV